jgi:hypothetical protein
MVRVAIVEVALSTGKPAPFAGVVGMMMSSAAAGAPFGVQFCALFQFVALAPPPLSQVLFAAKTGPERLKKTASEKSTRFTQRL